MRPLQNGLNIIAIGSNDKDLALVINQLIYNRGGLVVSDSDKLYSLSLPIAGIMSDRDGKSIAADYIHIQKTVKDMGVNMSSPFMTLSFLALVVIPFAKIGERGLFDYNKFDWIK